MFFIRHNFLVPGRFIGCMPFSLCTIYVVENFSGAEMGCGCSAAALISMQIWLIKISALNWTNCSIDHRIQGNIRKRNTTKSQNLSGVKSILKSIQWFGRHRIVALISIGRPCVLYSPSSKKCLFDILDLWHFIVLEKLKKEHLSTWFSMCRCKNMNYNVSTFLSLPLEKPKNSTHTNYLLFSWRGKRYIFSLVLSYTTNSYLSHMQ